MISKIRIRILEKPDSDFWFRIQILGNSDSDSRNQIRILKNRIRIRIRIFSRIAAEFEVFYYLWEKKIDRSIFTKNNFSKKK